MPPSSIDALVVDPRDNAAMRGFMDDAYECADTPVPFLTYVGGDGVVETRLPNLNVEGVWESARDTRNLDAITLATNTGSDRWVGLEEDEKGGGTVLGGGGCVRECVEPGGPTLRREGVCLSVPSDLGIAALRTCGGGKVCSRALDSQPAPAGTPTTCTSLTPPCLDTARMRTPCTFPPPLAGL